MGYEATYTDSDGATISGPAAVVDAWRQAERTQAEQRRDWIADLMRQGVKAAHPDDGWVDRQRNVVHFCYATFDHRPAVGDVIALGRPDQYRLVQVTAIDPPSVLGQMFADRGGYRAQPYYHFTAYADQCRQ